MKIHVGQGPSAEQRENIVVSGLLHRPELVANIFSCCDAHRIFMIHVGQRENFIKIAAIIITRIFEVCRSSSQCSDVLPSPLFTRDNYFHILFGKDIL